MALIVPGVARFSLHGVIIDRPWTCVFDMDIDSGGIGGRDDNVADQAMVFLNEWIDHIRPRVATAMTLLGCRWVDLDTATGTTGEATTATAPRVMPSAGTGGTEPMSSNVSLLARKRVRSGRGIRQGRSYWPGLREANVLNNVVLAADVTLWNTALDDFLAGINQSGGTSIGGYDSRLVVVHAPGGVFASFDAVSSLDPDTRVATQRRRLRG